MDAQILVHPHLTVDASSWFTSRCLAKPCSLKLEEAEGSPEEQPCDVRGSCCSAVEGLM